MKTKNSLSSLRKTFSIPETGFLLMALLFSFGTGIVHGQKLSIGASLSGIVSGSGLGSSVSPQFTLSAKKHTLSAGINIQSRYGNFSGLRGRYAYTFNLYEPAEVFFFYDVAWHNQARLGTYTVKAESALNPESSLYFNYAEIKTLEQHIGFGMNVRVSGSFKIFGAWGAGYYNTLGFKEQSLFQYREKANFSLLLMAGMKVDIVRVKR
ncbi:MAG: hypothetical protein HY841_09640 [Bacteroidetes bacterium]|nr:hypothetical protein [Bacteroidota bacterium]